MQCVVRAFRSDLFAERAFLLGKKVTAAFFFSVYLLATCRRWPRRRATNSAASSPHLCLHFRVTFFSRSRLCNVRPSVSSLSPLSSPSYHVSLSLFPSTPFDYRYDTPFALPISEIVTHTVGCRQRSFERPRNMPFVKKLVTNNCLFAAYLISAALASML